MISRRTFFKLMSLVGPSGVAGSGYAYAETLTERVKTHRVTPPGWPSGLRLRVAIIADLHACNPWMAEERVRAIVRQINALKPDVVLLLGDYVVSTGIRKYSTPVSYGAWASALAGLSAPFGVHAVLGNHDWWADIDVQRRRRGPVPSRIALEAAGIPVYENDAVRLEKDGQAFWIAGLGDQWAFWPRPEDNDEFVRTRKKDYTGVDDMEGTLREVTDDAPVILMAHEPDVFPTVPKRVSLTLSGHTHGGQFRLFGYSPFVPSKFGTRYIYGHIVEENRHLVVSGGLGVSGIPMRLGSASEITVVELGSGSGV